MIALKLGYLKGTLSNHRYHKLLKELDTVPEKAAWILNHHDNIKSIGEKYKDHMISYI